MKNVLTVENVSFECFRKECAEFFSLSKNLDAGFNALIFLFVGRSDNWSEKEVHEASLLIDLAPTARE